MTKRQFATLGAALLGLAAIAIAGSSRLAPASAVHTATPAAGAGWSAQNLKGNVRLAGEVPIPVAHGKARYVGPHAPNSIISVDLGLPIRNMAGLNWLIANEAKTHTYISRTQLYDTYSPPTSQIAALGTWLQSKGLRITHAGADRLSITATGTTANVEAALHVKINDYVNAASKFQAVKVKPYVFYSNTTSPVVPARFGIQSASGLTDVDRFFTQAQLDTAANQAARHSGGVAPVAVGSPAACGDDESDDTADGGAQCTLTRAGSGYYPSDVRSMYDVPSTINGTGQTIGFTLWGAGETQTAMNFFSQDTGDPLITVDPACVATSNGPGVPSSCTTKTVAGNHLLNILENGNTNDNFAGNTETALDVEQAHGEANGAGLKYYLSDCSTVTPPGSGLTNASCNGSDVGMEEAIEDAANDRTLHSVSNSWAFGGEAEMGNTDPFYLASNASLAIAAAAGTTFYFSTGDSGTYESGYPSDSPYVVAVGGTTLFSTQALPAGTTGAPPSAQNPSGTTGVPGTGTASLSTEDTWAAGGSWCSNIIARPSWQNITQVNGAAPCPGRVIPDVSAVADTNSAVLFVASTNGTGGIRTGGVGGTSVAAPEMNGLEADTETFIAAQTYQGTTPPIGFEAPMIYQLGAENSNAYYRDVLCGNTASPGSAPDGDAAQPGWDPATGWGAPDLLHFATGYAIALGATNLAAPSSTSQDYSWSCAKTPSNSAERGLSFPSSSVGYAVGSASGSTPWPATFLPSGSWGAVNTFFKSTDGGSTWVPSNSDMMSVACPSATSCVEVGDGGVIKTSSDGGTTWTTVTSGDDKALTQVACPSTSVCYAAGDRGIVLESADGGQTWSYLKSTDGNPIYGLSCPSTTTCYATDIYGHVIKTSDGGATWTWQSTPITTPGLAVPGSGGPNPYAGLMSISCSSVSTCVATGLYAIVSGQALPSSDPPIITTTNGGTTWTLQTSNAGGTQSSSTTLSAPTVVGATVIKVASVSNFTVGQTVVVDSTGAHPETVTVASIGSGARTATTLAAASLVNATNIKVTSVTNMVAGEQIAIDTGVNQEFDTIQSVGTAGSAGTGVTVTTPLALAHASGVAAQDIGTGVAISPALSFAHAAGATISELLPNFLQGVACVSGTTNCTAVGRNGAIVSTTNLTTWTKATSGTTNVLTGVTCSSATACIATGQNGTVDVETGGVWAATTGNASGNFLASIACPGATTCFTVGKQGITLDTTNLSTWTVQAGGGTTQQMNSVSCPSATTCFAAGNAGTILATTNGGQTWIAQTSGTTSALTGIACSTSTNCTAVGAAGTVKFTTDGSSWQTGASGITTALSGIACVSSTVCTAVGAGGTVIATADGGATWTAKTSGTTVGLNAVACSGSTCYAAGATTGPPTAAVIIKTTDGTTWTPQVSHSAQALAAITCLDSSNCFAGGTGGTVVTTSDGTNWNQQGNPLSGPTTALNATTSAIIGINGAACSSVRCAFGTGSSGDIMTSPLLTVTVNVSQMFGTTPLLTGLSPTATSISYSIPSEAANVTGTLTCSTTATSTSIVGTYPISACSGLADNGFSVVYNYAGSSYKVITATTTTVLTSSVNPANPGQAVTYTATVAPTPTGGTVAFSDGGSPIATCTAVPVVAGVATCTVSYPKTGNHDIKAVYSGNTNSLGSTSETLGETVANCGASPKGCNLQGADFTNADLAGLDLSGANLQKAVFDGANLAGTNLSGSNMQGESFVGADLTGANLSGANLQKSDFTNAILVGANLQGANVQNSDMTGANLNQALTKGANLNKVTWSNTTCPDGTNSASHGSSCASNL